MADESEARAAKASQGINEAASKIAKGAPETGDAIESDIRDAAKQVKDGAPKAADMASKVGGCQPQLHRMLSAALEKQLHVKIS